jgi:bifunctional non-homologous end joining protein LigD
MQILLQQSSMPNWIDPMLATLTDEPFSDSKWIYERKFDGERCLTFKKDDDVRLLSRNQKVLNTHYPDLEEAMRQNLPDRVILDGELVAFEGNVTSFSRLQNRMHIQDPEQARQSDVSVYIYLFDILYLDGYDLTQIPQRSRKSILKSVVSYDDPLRFTSHRNQEGEAYFKEACRKGWEGIIAKDAGSPYHHSRSKKWLKFKCVKEQELVIGGYTDPQGKRIGFGALLVGYHEGGRLRYAGKVGTGFDDDTLQRLKHRMSELEKDNPPFTPDADLPNKDVHWIEAQLVAQIGFEEWTRNDKLRQPRFLGLREDKEAQDVIKEEAQS